MPAARSADQKSATAALGFEAAVALLIVAATIQFSGWLPAFGIRIAAALVLVAMGARVLAVRVARSVAPNIAPIIARPVGRPLRLLAWFAFAVIALSWRIDAQLASRLDPALDGQMLALEVVIDSMADRGGFGERLTARVEDCRPQAGTATTGTSEAVPPLAGCRNLTRVQLNWALERVRDRTDHATAGWPEPGERWSISGRALRPAAPVNRGLFDFELRLLEEGVGAIVRVRERRWLAASSPAAWWRDPGIAFEAWRARLRATVEARAIAATRGGGDPPWAALGLVNALALGDQRGLPAADWALFSRTGVSHLMAISGMHVTMMAWLGGLLVNAGLRRSAARGLVPALVVTRRFGRARLVAAVQIGLAFGYALLSGWGIASQRTCWMLLVATLLVSGSRAAGPIVATVAATAPILILDPWAVSAAGFWLSFGAVLAIIWQASGLAAQGPSEDNRRLAITAGGMPAALAVEPGRGPGSAVRPKRLAALSGRLLRLTALLRPLVILLGTQWAATVALLPLTIALFGAASVIGPLVNLLAIPWVSLIVTPAALALTLVAGLPWPAVIDPWPWAWWLLDSGIGAMMATLRWVDAWPLASVRIAAPPPALLLAAVVGAAWLLAPRGTGRRWLGLAGLLPLLVAGRMLPPVDELRVTAFDLGLGSAVLVESGDLRVLIDTGGGQPGPEGPGPASRMIVPTLGRRGIDRIDGLVLTHRDREHVAGTATVVAALKPAWIATAFDLRWLPIDAGRQRWQVCLAGESLDLGGLRLEFRWPATKAASRLEAGDNARSCVVRIVHAAGSVLAAGDLPLRDEARLLGRDGADEGRRGLAADILIVPGQGSRQAAGAALVGAVAPSIALIQAARGHPQRIVQPVVVERLEAVGATVLRTDRDGAVTVSLKAGEAPRIDRARRDAPPYWRIGDPAER